MPGHSLHGVALECNAGAPTPHDAWLCDEARENEERTWKSGVISGPLMLPPSLQTIPSYISSERTVDVRVYAAKRGEAFHGRAAAVRGGGRATETTLDE